MWLRENGFPWDERVCTAAASKGRLDILKWAREHGCPWNVNTFQAASAKRGRGCSFSKTSAQCISIWGWNVHLWWIFRQQSFRSFLFPFWYYSFLLYLPIALYLHFSASPHRNFLADRPISGSGEWITLSIEGSLERRGHSSVVLGITMAIHGGNSKSGPLSDVHLWSFGMCTIKGKGSKV